MECLSRQSAGLNATTHFRITTEHCSCPARTCAKCPPHYWKLIHRKRRLKLTSSPLQSASSLQVCARFLPGKSGFRSGTSIIRICSQLLQKTFLTAKCSTIISHIFFPRPPPNFQGGKKKKKPPPVFFPHFVFFGPKWKKNKSLFPRKKKIAPVWCLQIKLITCPLIRIPFQSNTNRVKVSNESFPSVSNSLDAWIAALNLRAYHSFSVDSVVISLAMSMSMFVLQLKRVHENLCGTLDLAFSHFQCPWTEFRQLDGFRFFPITQPSNRLNCLFVLRDCFYLQFGTPSKLECGKLWSDTYCNQK